MSLRSVASGVVVMRPVASAYRFDAQPQLVRLSGEDSRRQHLACFLRVAVVAALITAGAILYAVLR